MPELRDLTIRLLGIPVLSSPSERVFSADGCTRTSRRTNLSSEHSEKSCILRETPGYIQIQKKNDF